MNDMTIISVGEFKKERNWGKGQKTRERTARRGTSTAGVLVLEQQFFLRKVCKRITGMKY